MTQIFDHLLLSCRKLSVFDYSINMFIGAYDVERLQPQPVVFNIDVWVRTADSDADTLEGVYDYTLIPQAVDAVVADGHIDLQETLVDAIADRLMIDPRVQAVRVASRKPQAYPNCRAIGVELFKTKNK